MGRATLKEVTARKPTTCQTCQAPIQPGTKYWKLAAFRQQAKFCQQHQPSNEQVRHFAPQSRADRASEQADQIREASEELQSIADEVNTILSGMDDRTEFTDEEKEELLAFKERAEKVGVDFSELESLAEEMRSWADNMDSGNLGHTSKYDEVEEVAGILEGIDADAEIPSAPEEMTVEAWESFAEECETQASELDSKADELEGVSFPGMY